MVQAPTEPSMTSATVLRHTDAAHELAGVRLVQEIGLAQEQFVYDETERVWSLRLPPLPVWRLEYRLELRYPDGRTELVRDPANPLITPGAFGDKSVLELPGYRRPAWLDRPAAEGTWTDLTIPSTALRREVPVRIRTSAQPSRGILLAHDGGEFDRLAGLGQFSAAMIADGTLPPHDLVLLSPVERNEWYSANPAYARALVTEIIPRLRPGLPIVALGASLGALSLLHAQIRYPYTFQGLFLQSGSFFQNRYDAQESSFPPYPRIIRFVGSVRRRRRVDDPVSTVLTCGIPEENLANNRAMATILGPNARLVEVPDAHNFIAWRDAWHPDLTALAGRVWE
ncbi:MAG TPA: alpha/beta hydrolase-fold protein [Micromonosporaceae bacterium]